MYKTKIKIKIHVSMVTSIEQLEQITRLKMSL